jgi:transcriptional regulator of arginine metabolism
LKFERHLKILGLIDRYAIETQEELADHLKNQGYDVTQATISRDIKELRLIKVLASDGKYKYQSGIKDNVDKTSQKLATIFRECVVNIDCAKNIVVIKTINGLASGAAAAIDSMNLSEIVGTLAGDDTILAVFYDDESAVEFVTQQKRALNR